MARFVAYIKKGMKLADVNTEDGHSLGAGDEYLELPTIKAT